MTITMPRKTVTASGVIAAESEVLKQGHIGRKATVSDVAMTAHPQEQNIVTCLSLRSSASRHLPGTQGTYHSSTPRLTKNG